MNKDEDNQLTINNKNQEDNFQGTSNGKYDSSLFPNV